MEDDKIIWGNPLKDAKIFGRWLLSSVIDSGFMAGWVVIQWSAQQIVSRYPLQGIDAWVLYIFQIVFAITTLVPVLAYIVMDLAVMVIRVRRYLYVETTKNR